MLHDHLHFSRIILSTPYLDYNSLTLRDICWMIDGLTIEKYLQVSSGSPFHWSASPSPYHQGLSLSKEAVSCLETIWSRSSVLCSINPRLKKSRKSRTTVLAACSSTTEYPELRRYEMCLTEPEHLPKATRLAWCYRGRNPRWLTSRLRISGFRLVLPRRWKVVSVRQSADRTKFNVNVNTESYSVVVKCKFPLFPLIVYLHSTTPYIPRRLLQRTKLTAQVPSRLPLPV